MRTSIPVFAGLCLCIIGAARVCAAPASAPSTRSEAELARESVDQLVLRYLSALADSDETALRGIMEFETPADQTAFFENLRRRKMVAEGLPRDRSKPAYQVSLRHRRRHSTAVYLIPTRQGYVPQTFTVVEVDGRPRVKYADESAGAREKTVVQQSIDRMRRTIGSWRDAKGDALKEKAVEFKEGLQDRIAALSMAKEKGLRLVSGSGTTEEVQQAYDSMKSLSDTELRSLMIDRLEKELGRLVPNTQSSKPNT